MSKKLKILSIVLVVALVGAGYGFYLFNKKVSVLDDAKPDFRISANEIFDAYETDEQNANAMYENKIVEVTGVVESIKNDEMQNNIIIKADNAMMGGVNCSMNRRFDDVSEGQEVTIKGRCQGYLMDVILNNCNVVGK